MFEITSNEFIKNDVVKYTDENGNTLRVTAAKNGNELSVKLRLKNNITIDVLRFKMPIKESGIYFNINYPNEETKLEYEKNIYPVLQDTIRIIQYWIDICNNLHALTSSDMSTIANICSNDKSGLTYDENLMTITEFILNELSLYEEMSDFVDLYVKIATH